VFKIQTYNWQKERWIKDQTILDEMQEILASGGRNIAYYPDNFWVNRPALEKVRLEMSVNTFPFLP